MVPLVEDIVVVMVVVREAGDIGNESGARCVDIDGLALIYKRVLQGKGRGEVYTEEERESKEEGESKR